MITDSRSEAYAAAGGDISRFRENPDVSMGITSPPRTVVLLFFSSMKNVMAVVEVMKANCV